MHPRMYPSYRGAHANRGRKTESSERRLRAERGGKRLWLTRRRRLRTGREATLRSDEHRATGAASGGAASVHRVAGLPVATGSEAPVQGHGSTPTAPVEPAVRRRHRRRHGQPGQRERRQAAGPGNRSRVQLRERRVGHRPDRVGGAPSPGNRWWRRWQRGRATGDRATTGIARRAFGHDGRCVGRAKANARRSTSGGSSHLSGSPGWVRRRKQAAPPGATQLFRVGYRAARRLALVGSLDRRQMSIFSILTASRRSTRRAFSRSESAIMSSMMAGDDLPAQPVTCRAPSRTVRRLPPPSSSASQ